MPTLLLIARFADLKETGELAAPVRLSSLAERQIAPEHVFAPLALSGRNQVRTSTASGRARTERFMPKLAARSHYASARAPSGYRCAPMAQIPVEGGSTHVIVG